MKARTASLAMVTATIIAVSWPASAQQMPSALALSCGACHGVDGKSPGAIPVLAGRPSKDIKDALLGFKTGTRPSTVMSRMAKAYTNEEIDSLAAYFSSRK